ncbi:hypothetical protein D9611_014833 [Ephemerocybe angulata]|uniref:Uncharacterized protein n=1 Tax=Ephemerocybe angulata TaxID=980116 RepID=A0A8H5FI13_9AGAR|nr:hypothetical protein D9611_014833 [Tulosesus angulatus]
MLVEHTADPAGDGRRQSPIGDAMPEQDDRTLHGSTGTDVEDAAVQSPKTTTAHSEADYTPRDDPDSDERCQGTDHTEDIDHDTASTASADLPIDNIILETLSAPSRSSTAKESKDLKKTRLSATKESGRKKTRSSNQNPLGSRNRYRLCDFTGPTRVVLNDTIDLFRVFCVTKDPFPEVTGRQLRLAVDSWAKAAERRAYRSHTLTKPPLWLRTGPRRSEDASNL